MQKVIFAKCESKLVDTDNPTKGPWFGKIHEGC